MCQTRLAALRSDFRRFPNGRMNGKLSRILLNGTRSAVEIVSCCLKFPVAFVILLLCGQSAMAQQNQQVRVVETIWGFDGRVVPGQFMPLSILIDNLSDQPIEATAQLRRVTGMVNEVGGLSVQPVFLGPNSRRWVQFYPYIADQSASWHFTLQTEDKTYTFDPMDQPRAVFSRNRADNEPDQSLPGVILDPPGMGTRSPTSIKHMPAEIFPPYATAMHGLYSLFLDHVPDWEAPRQEALLSWLKSGGRLHLLLDANNETLRFSGILAALNEPFPEFSVGNGTVIRHDVQRSDLSIQIVTPAVTPPELKNTSADDDDFNQTSQNRSGFRTSGTVDDEELFSWLRDLTQPDHSWILIFLLSLCYVGLIFPGCWILSKQRTLHFLVTYGAIAGLAAIFSLIFLFIGQRGYGESTSIHTLSVARAEDETHWSSIEYSTLFVTSGDRYATEETDRQTLMASGATSERVDAVMTSGNSASFISRIPPFSSQSILCRRRVTTDNWNLAISEIAQSGEDLSQLTMTFNDKFPLGDKIKYFVMHGKYIYTAIVIKEKNQLAIANNRTLLRTFCWPTEEIDFRTTMRPQISNPNPDPIQECFEKSLPRLVARSFSEDFVNDLSRFQLPADKVRLLIYSPIPESLQLSVDTDVKRDGRILFVRDIAIGSNSVAE